MKPTPNRAAPRKPCKKQASVSSIKRPDSQLICDPSICSNVQLDNKTDNLDSSLSTLHSFLSTSSCLSPSLNKIKNPYLKQQPPPTKISCHTKALLEYDEIAFRQEVRSDMSTSISDDSDDDSDSDFTPPTNVASLPRFIAPSTRTTNRHEKRTSSLRPHLPHIPPIDFNPPSPEPSIPSQPNAATFDISNIRTILNSYTEEASISKHSAASSIIATIHQECDRFENLQRQFNATQRHITPAITELKEEMQSLSQASIFHQPTKPKEGRPNFAHINPYAAPDDSTFLSHVSSISSEVSHESPKHDEKHVPSDAILYHDDPDQSSLDDSLAPSVSRPSSSLPDPNSIKKSIFIRNEPSKINSTLAPSPQVMQPLTSFSNPHEKQEGALRFVAQNCRGALQTGKNKHEHYTPAMESFLNLAADVVLLSETNTDWSIRDNHWDTLLMNRAIWAPSPTKTTTASCKWNNRHRTSFQVGGTMSLFSGTLTPRIHSSAGDKYGRWTKTSIHMQHNKKLVVYNVYRTHAKDLSTAGVASPWMQQWTAIRNDTGADTDPRQLHMQDLVASVEKEALSDNEILILGDFNEDIDDKEPEGLRLLESCPHTINVFLHMHGEIPSSRQNTRRIFHVYASPNVLPFIHKSGTCSPIDGFSTSDHIPFFLDIDQTLFTGDMSSIIPPAARILQMYDTTTVARYVQNVLHRLNNQSISKRLQELSKKISFSGFDAQACSEIEKIDETVTNIRLQEERNLLKRPTRYKGTSVTKTQVQKIRLLRTLRKFHQAGKECTHILRRLETYEYLQEINPDNLSAIITEEKQLLKQLQEDNDLHREEHLDKIYDALAAEKSRDKATIVKEMKNREKQKKSWRKIAYVTKAHRKGVTRLGVPKGFESAPTQDIWNYLSDPKCEPEWTFLTDPDAINRRLVEWQSFHYSQAGETPLAALDWYSRLNPNSIAPSDVQDILQGNSSNLPPHVHPTTEVFFDTLSENLLPEMPPESIDITTKKYRQFYSKTKERTSSSPSGLHMGLWKAAATSEPLSSILSSIVQIALSNSYVLTRWKKVIGVLLEKKSGFPVINKFRTIHLIESDLNFAMRSIWGRELMKWAESHQGFSDNQYGGRKGLQAQTAAWNKTLTCDIIRYYGEPASLIDNDAQACYDRIIPVVAAYTLMRLGMPLHLVRLQIKWLEQTQYELNLNGKKSSTYSTHNDSYLHGTGQGTGWSPPTWGSISDIISKILNDHSPGIKLVHPNRSSIERVLDAFVDDVNGGLTFDSFEDFLKRHPTLVPRGKDVYAQTREMVQFYSRVLFSTGGKLALHKCAVYILLTKWVKGRRKFAHTHKTFPPLQIHQGMHTQQVDHIKIEDPSIARRMLGVYASPDGNSRMQTKILRNKSEQWKTRVSSHYLNSYDTLMSYKQGLMKQLEYPVGASMVTDTNCAHIQSPALNACLQKNGIVSTIARIIIFSPYRYGGLGLTSLYTENGIQKVELLLGHLRRRDKTSKIIQVALGCIQQEVGVPTFILQLQYKKYESIVTHSWMKLLWKFLDDINGSIQYPSAWTPPSTFEYDINIVEAFMKWELTDEQRYNLNICRLYKKCYFIGDLLDPAGVRLRPGSLNMGSRNFHNDKFPDIPPLPKSFEELWQSSIRRMINEYSLGKSLGVITSARSYEWGLDSTLTFLIRYAQGRQIQLFTRVRHNVYRSTPSSLNVPVHMAYVCLVDARDTFNISTSKALLHSPQAPQLLSSYFPAVHPGTNACTHTHFRAFMLYLRNLPQIHQRNLGQLEVHEEDFPHLIQCMRTNKIMGVCDASVNNKKAGHSYILESNDEQSSISGVAPTDADPDDITSNRAEGCSVLALIVLSTALASFFQMEGITVPIYCDNAEALRHSSLSGITYSKLVKRDIDLKLEIAYVRSISAVNIVFRKVKAHLDDASSFVYELADQEVKRNIDMDIKAKQFLDSPPPPLMPTQNPGFFPSQQAGLYLANTLIVGDVRSQIHLHHYGYAMELRIKDMLQVSQRQLQSIDWAAFHIAFKSLPADKKISHMKHIHNYLPVKHRLHERDKSISARCPRCQSSNETQEHIFQCKRKMNKRNHTSCIKILRSTLRKCHTHLLIVNAIDLFITRVHQGSTPTYAKPALGDFGKIEVVAQVFSQQAKLGAFSLHKGFVSRNWMIAQNVCTSVQNNAYIDETWLKKFIRALWDFSNSMWIKRCQNVHVKNKDDPCSLTHNELLFSIREILRVRRNDLSHIEKQLHLNVTRGLQVAHTRTLVDWLLLLSQEREKTIRLKRESRLKETKLQTITKFCRVIRK